jgi:hypothetical protein
MEEPALTAKRGTASEYRQRVRRKLASTYSGSVHLAALLLCSSTGAVVPLLLVADWRTAFQSAVIVMVYANFVEWGIHRYGGHVIQWKFPLLRAFHKYHAVVHHTFFQGQQHANVESDRDLFFVLFPAWVYVGWLLVGFLPASLVLSRTSWQRDAVLGALSASALALAQYEALHTFCHRGLPRRLQATLELSQTLVALQRRHHKHHARPGCNYNITWPLADWTLGTLARRDHPHDA